MSATTVPPHTDLLPLPGFFPDAVPFAVRTTLSLLLAYAVAFSLQLDTASSAGLCVAIVAQPSPGMSLSKAIYRTAGTVLGGAVALVVVAAFPQDRTMLLLCFTLWLGACTFVAALLRDFRSYGAVLCGYTVGIIAVSGIDTPDGALTATLNRVAAILIGILSVALVNTLLARPVAFDSLVSDLRQHLDALRTLAVDTLEGRSAPDMAFSVGAGATILQLRTQAVYAGAEMAGGVARRHGAVAAVAGLLGMLSACRALSAEPAGPEARDRLMQAAQVLKAGALNVGALQAGALQAGETMPPAPPPQTAAAAFFAERADELLAHYAMAADGLRVLEEGGRVQQTVRLRIHYDQVGAALSAIRTMIGVAGGAVFCILAGWPGATGLLVQQAAFTALLGMAPNPSAAGEAMGVAVPFGAAAAWLVGYVLLPDASGFVPFALAVGLFAFLFSLAGRQPRLQRFGAGFMLYFTLLLAPSNVESFDLSGFGNEVLVQVIAVAFMVLAFRLVLPVSRKRRLLRIADAIAGDLQGTLARGRTLNEAATHLLEYDRMAQAEVWAGRRTPARVAVLERMGAMIDLDLELRRAWSGVLAPGLDGPAAAQARAALLAHDPGQLDEAAGALLCSPGQPARAVSGLHAAARMLRQQSSALRHYGLAS